MMTSTTILGDVQAARTHLEEVVPRLTGANRTEVHSIITRLSTLIKKLGGK